jgi:hypothetical protein
MSTKKRDFDPNATMQIVLEPSELVDAANALGAADALGEPRSSRARSLPPPLPPEAALVPSHAPPSRRTGRTIGIVVMFVLLVGAAIGGGLLVGVRARGGATAAPSAAGSQEILTIPTIEMK